MQPVDHDEVQRGFTHVTPVLCEMIDCRKDWTLWALCDRGPVALLGTRRIP